MQANPDIMKVKPDMMQVNPKITPKKVGRKREGLEWVRPSTQTLDPKQQTIDGLFNLLMQCEAILLLLNQDMKLKQKQNALIRNLFEQPCPEIKKFFLQLIFAHYGINLFDANNKIFVENIYRRFFYPPAILLDSNVDEIKKLCHQIAQLPKTTALLRLSKAFLVGIHSKEAGQQLVDLLLIKIMRFYVALFPEIRDTQSRAYLSVRSMLKTALLDAIDTKDLLVNVAKLELFYEFLAYLSGQTDGHPSNISIYILLKKREKLFHLTPPLSQSELSMDQKEMENIHSYYISLCQHLPIFSQYYSLRQKISTYLGLMYFSYKVSGNQLDFANLLFLGFLFRLSQCFSSSLKFFFLIVVTFFYFRELSDVFDAENLKVFGCLLMLTLGDIFQHRWQLNRAFKLIQVDSGIITYFQELHVPKELDSLAGPSKYEKKVPNVRIATFPAPGEISNYKYDLVQDIYNRRKPLNPKSSRSRFPALSKFFTTASEIGVSQETGNSLFLNGLINVKDARIKHIRNNTGGVSYALVNPQIIKQDMEWETTLETLDELRFQNDPKGSGNSKQTGIKLIKGFIPHITLKIFCGSELRIYDNLQLGYEYSPPGKSIGNRLLGCLIPGDKQTGSQPLILLLCSTSHLDHASQLKRLDKTKIELDLSPPAFDLRPII